MNTTVKSVSKIKGEEGYIFVDDGGHGDLPIVFTHAFASDSSTWKKQLLHVRSSRRAIAFDFRGHGKSETSPMARYTAEALANDIVAVVDGLDIEKFVLVGHSMGGGAAIAYTNTHPTRVGALVLVGTPGKTPQEISKPVIASLESDAYQKVMDDYMATLLKGATSHVASAITAGARKLSRETTTNIIKALFEYDPVAHVNQYHGPKLIIVTTGDQKLPNSLHNQVTGVPVKVIEGTSHWPQADKPEVFNQILDTFLKGLK